MNTDNVRINVTIPRELIQVVDRVSGPRKRSSFIAEAIRFKIERDKKAALEKQLAEGYRDCKEESMEIAREFESADLEGWDDRY
jgi:metal-responsive CopG/Arc/MetJ family transcriptional regulator